MQCAHCHAENRDLAVFCRGCGHRLEFVCPSCRARVEGGSSFCDACGVALHSSPVAPLRPDSPVSYTPPHLARKILTVRSAVEGERKQVTVLFVDVSGFTALAERLDPEDVHGIMANAFERILAEVHRYEGTVNQFLGDGVMALFGAPIAHEDHARRAVHAALGIRGSLEALDNELRRTRDITFRVRQGLNTGLVVVGGIGSDLRMDYTAVGDTTNVASRLQHAADSGRIVISAATHKLIDGYFYTRSLGAVELKGKAELFDAWEVIAARGARSRMEVESERGLTPFFGRERELRLLRDAFAKARDGHGQVVVVAGDAGIGKSRLLLELRHRIGDDATWLEGHTVPFRRSTPFHPLIDLLKRNFRIEDGDGDAAIAGKVERGVLLLGQDLRPIIPYLRSLLSLDPGDAAVAAMDPRRRQAGAFDALRRLLVRAAEIRPQVCVYEDVHWMDQATEDMLRMMDEIVPSHRILQILTCRTGYPLNLPERSYHSRITVDVLAPADSVDMACAMLGVDRLPDLLRAVVTDKAEGNPFFVEEIVKSLREVRALQREGPGYVIVGPVDENLPSTVRDIIMARVDRLEEQPKRMLQLASVIGRDFTRRILEHLSAELDGGPDAALARLVDAELVYQTRLFPEVSYTFRHALTQDVAYSSLLLQRRRDLHGRIGAAVESLYADRLPEHYEVLAHHYERGHDPAKALEYLLRAGDKAAHAYANREALSFYEKALERVAADDHRRRADLLRRLATVTQYLGDADTSLRHAEQAVTLYEAIGDKRNAVAMHLHIDVLYSWQWDGAREDEGLKHVEAAAALVDSDPDSVEKGLVYQRTGHRYLHRCQPHTTVAWAQKAVDLFDRLGVSMGTSLGTALSYTGQIETGNAYSESHWESVRKAGVPVVLAVFGHELTLTLALARNVPRAREWGERVLSEVARSSPVFEAMLRRPLAFVYALSGETNKALETAAAVERIEADSLLGCIYEDAGAVGLLYAQLGDPERGRRYLHRLLPLYRERGNLPAVSACALILGQLHLEAGDLAVATPLLEEALAIAAGGGNLLLEAWARPVMARLCLGRDDLDGAVGHISSGLALLSSDRKWYGVPAPLLLVRGLVRTRQRRWDDAKRDFESARTIASAFDLAWDEARAIQEHARMLRAQGGRHDGGPGRASSDRTRAILERLGTEECAKQDRMRTGETSGERLAG